MKIAASQVVDLDNADTALAADSLRFDAGWNVTAYPRAVSAARHRFDVTVLIAWELEPGDRVRVRLPADMPGWSGRTEWTGTVHGVNGSSIDIADRFGRVEPVDAEWVWPA